MRRTTISVAAPLWLTALLTVTLAGSEASAASQSRSAIPPGFRAQSLTWVSPMHGWMLGSAPCGQATCTTVAGTTDDGGTWNTLGTLDAPLTLEEKTGVTEIRFADDLHGWVFYPALWTTTDGGATWTKEAPPGGRPLVALAGDADGVFAVVSACRFSEPIDHCTRSTTLWRTMPGQGSWTKVSLTLPVSNGSSPTQTILAVHGLVAYLIVQAGEADPDVLDVTLDGQHWTSRPDPCIKGQDEYLSGVAPISDTKVALLCTGDPGFGNAEKRAFRSRDTGQTTSQAGGITRNYGIVSQLAAAPNGTLLVSSYSSGSWIYRNAVGQPWTTQVDLGDGGMGWNDIRFTTNQIGFVVHGPASCCGGHGPGELWETEDGGLTWSPV